MKHTHETGGYDGNEQPSKGDLFIVRESYALLKLVSTILASKDPQLISRLHKIISELAILGTIAERRNTHHTVEDSRVKPLYMEQVPTLPQDTFPPVPEIKLISESAVAVPGWEKYDNFAGIIILYDVVREKKWRAIEWPHILNIISVLSQHKDYRSNQEEKAKIIERLRTFVMKGLIVSIVVNEKLYLLPTPEFAHELIKGIRSGL